MSALEKAHLTQPTSACANLPGNGTHHTHQFTLKTGGSRDTRKWKDPKEDSPAGVHLETAMPSPSCARKAMIQAAAWPCHAEILTKAPKRQGVHPSCGPSFPHGTKEEPNLRAAKAP